MVWNQTKRAITALIKFEYLNPKSEIHPPEAGKNSNLGEQIVDDITINL